MTSYFIVCTPFQRVVAEILAGQMSDHETVCIDTTKDKVPVNDKSAFNRVLNISSSFSDLIHIWKFRKELRSRMKKEERIELFIPHVQTLFSSYFFRIAKTHEHIQLNVYYEGIAMFYDPKINIRRVTLLKRNIIGLISGFIYRNHVYLFPEELRKIACAYSPLPEFTEQFKSVKEFNFDSLCTKQLSGVSKTIILGAPLQSEEHLNDQLVRIKLILEKIQPTDEILLKPHYSSKPELLNAMKRQWRKEGVKCELLNDNRPIESVISRYNCDAVYAIHPTSALINLSLMFGPSVQFYFYPEHWLNERLSQVFSRLEITALDENQLTETLKLL